jgi:hypothetical protein
MAKNRDPFAALTDIAQKAGYISCIKVGHSVFFDREQVFSDLRRFQIGGPASR